MKNWKIINIGLIIILILGLYFDLHAGSPNRRGTAAATELLIPIGSAGVGLNGSTLAKAHGLDALFWNPAGLARSTLTSEVMFSNLQYIADIGVNYFAVSGNLGDFGYIAASLKTLSFGDIEVTTIDKPEGTGVTYSPTYMTIGLTYARRMTDRIFFGTNVKLVYESIQRVEASAFAFDFGLQYKAGETGFNFGIALKNLGTKIRFDGPDFERFVNDPNQPIGFPPQPYVIRTAAFDLPTTLELGLSYNYALATEHLLSLNTTFVNNNYSNDQYRFGVEYSYNNIIFLRGGYLVSPDIPGTLEGIFDFTFGAGIQYHISGIEMAVDYAYRPAKFFNANQWFTVRLGF
ncbi:MAG: hypothetical protein IGBAC_1781 [Ignavibacteriae bacterium]|nr:MAG: hypothetical protein IGBAC_1781 [Ignavibacteriota bacterium]